MLLYKQLLLMTFGTTLVYVKFKLYFRGFTTRLSNFHVHFSKCLKRSTRIVWTIPYLRPSGIKYAHCFPSTEQCVVKF